MHRFAEHAPWRKLVEEFLVGKKRAEPALRPKPRPNLHLK
jgi:hypothetical protein